jgi:hypothetical protein
MNPYLAKRSDTAQNLFTGGAGAGSGRTTPMHRHPQGVKRGRSGDAPHELETTDRRAYKKGVANALPSGPLDLEHPRLQPAHCEASLTKSPTKNFLPPVPCAGWFDPHNHLNLDTIRDCMAQAHAGNTAALAALEHLQTLLENILNLETAYMEPSELRTLVSCCSDFFTPHGAHACELFFCTPTRMGLEIECDSEQIYRLYRPQKYTQDKHSDAWEKMTVAERAEYVIENDIYNPRYHPTPDTAAGPLSKRPPSPHRISEVLEWVEASGSSGRHEFQSQPMESLAQLCAFFERIDPYIKYDATPHLHITPPEEARKSIQESVEMRERLTAVAFTVDTYCLLQTGFSEHPTFAQLHWFRPFNRHNLEEIQNHLLTGHCPPEEITWGRAIEVESRLKFHHIGMRGLGFYPGSFQLFGLELRYGSDSSEEGRRELVRDAAFFTEVLMNPLSVPKECCIDSKRFYFPPSEEMADCFAHTLFSADDPAFGEKHTMAREIFNAFNYEEITQHWIERMAIGIMPLEALPFLRKDADIDALRRAQQTFQDTFRKTVESLIATSTHLLTDRTMAQTCSKTLWLATTTLAQVIHENLEHDPIANMRDAMRATASTT